MPNNGASDMPTGQLSGVLRQLRRAALLRDSAGMTDGQLLECFVTRRDQAAFEALVRRHGPMVLGVCRRLLRNPHDTEDAFQATFLVLVRRAASIRQRELLGNWLYGVAYRTALDARTTTTRRRVRERQVHEMPEPKAGDREHDWLDLRPLLDQELNRLPDKYRVAVVLCDLEGQTRRDVARQLGIPVGTLSGRLTTARRMLARRLTRHGLALSGGALAAALSQGAAPACVPAPLVASTLQTAAGVVSAKVAALTQGVMKAMFVSKLKIATAFLVTLGILVGTGTLARSPAAKQAEKGQVATKEAKDTAAPDLTKVDRRIGKEPKYKSKSPRYCLLVFGPQRKHHVWLVLDGDTLYVDKNGNGNLTEEGKRIKVPAFSLSDYPAHVWERKIEVGDVSVGGLTHTDLVVSQWQYRRKVDVAALNRASIPSADTPQEWQEHMDRVWRQVPDGVVYEVTINLDPKCYGLFGDTKGQRVRHQAFADPQGRLAFAKRPQDAPVIHFGGPLTLCVQPGSKLRRGEEPVTRGNEETRFWLGAPGLGAGTFALMAHDLVPKDVHPVVEVQFAAQKPGQKEVSRKYVLESWAAWTFRGPMQVPDEAGLGMAKVTMTFADWKRGRVAPASGEVRVLDTEPKKNIKP